MNHIERFYATIEQRPVDRPASWLGLPAKEYERSLFDFFAVDNIVELKTKIEDDIIPVEFPYHSKTSDAIYCALDFTNGKHAKNTDDRTLTAPGFFEGYSDPGKIDDFPWPDPALYIDPEECREVVRKAGGDHAILGMVWSAHFQDACAAFGMETAMVKMMLEPEMFRAVIDRITEFYLKANEIFYTATEGKLHAVLIGNDLGSQNGLMLSPHLIREFILPGTKRLVQQAKNHGLKVIHHSCGAIRDIIPDLIETGVDAIHPIQALASGMDPQGLKNDFGKRVAFCGGVDTQYLLTNGTPDEIRKKVRELKNIFPTGLIISPSHEAILPDAKPENIFALFETVNER